MQTKQLSNSNYQHYSKDPSFVGYTTDIIYHPEIGREVNRFGKSKLEKLAALTEKLAWKTACEKKYGPDYKNIMKANKLNN